MVYVGLIEIILKKVKMTLYFPLNIKVKSKHRDKKRSSEYE